MSPALAGRFFNTSAIWEACGGGGLIAKSCPTFFNSMDYSQALGSSVHGISQASV